MKSKEWYKANYEFYKSAYLSQAKDLRELRREVCELKSVLHVANAALKLKKGEK